jgi:putative DNA primase/helicase
MIEAALDYARRGMSVFPCEKKIPLVATGFKAASRDEEQIRKWWSAHPDAQIGLPTGRVNGLFVLDIDGEQGASIAAKWKLPETFTVETQPRHWQAWFKQPEGVETKCSAGVLGPELDVRGDGGYVIAPPSIHHETGNPYRIVKNLALADVPSVLLEPKKNETLPASVNKIPQGQRHRTLLSIAGSLRARGFSREMVLSQLEIVNERQCAPPLDARKIAGLADYVATKPPGIRGQKRIEPSAEVEFECFDQVKAEQMCWLWHKRIPLGKLCLFVGDPGQGKSLATIDIASRVSRGSDFPDGAHSEVGDVIFLSAEDDPSDTQLPRLLIAGADVSRIHRIKAVRVNLPDGATGQSMFNLERDVEKLDEALARLPKASLLVIDPLSAYLGRVDSHRDAEIRSVLAPLAELAAKRRIAVNAVMHLKKTETTALLRVSGSIGFVASARVVWGFGENPDQAGSHVMVCVKNNLAAMGDGLAYSIEADGEIPRIVWQAGSISLDANSVLSIERRERGDRGARRGAAERWLAAQLQSGNEVPVAEIITAAAEADFSWRTIERAKKQVGARAVKRGGLWAWFLA